MEHTDITDTFALQSDGGFLRKLISQPLIRDHDLAAAVEPT